jgi:hypothetical protein
MARRRPQTPGWAQWLQALVTLALVCAAVAQRQNLEEQRRLVERLDRATQTRGLLDVLPALPGRTSSPRGSPQCKGSTVDIDGQCYVRTAEIPPCPRDQRHEGDGCYYLVPKPRPPQAGEDYDHRR